ncbi:alpha/beta fold hydrolase [Minwuia thermotolerans]|uniref:Alpha/beta hydrolase n=1 Tax=Minwuia thermotolerans TaxID=2056226 RepID=A0A2M9G705_9PROT|nr:alpha/beta hydrolase [Minwuia thermotolerans]PJK31456.1 alpha/beta hydrolase [Minwuia thermotolerans]
MTVTATDHSVASGRKGLNVLVRNKRGGSGPPVLFVHGATYPSTIMFDYPVEGVSWLDWMAGRGFDAWCVDLLGYGVADRPPEMDQAAEANGPIVDTAEAVGDVKRVIDFILAERGVGQLDLLGYSWGTAIGGQVAGDLPEKIRRLVLAGALWLRSGNVQIAVPGQLGAYRTVDADAIVKRWTVDLDDAQRDAIAPAERLRAWAEAAVATDPESVRHDPPRLRAPTGVVKDVQQHWLKGDPTYDPGRIRCPTMVVVGEWDRETTPEQGLEVFSRLTGTAERRFTMIGGGTHSLLLENQRHQLRDVVAGWLSA